MFAGRSVTTNRAWEELRLPTLEVRRVSLAGHDFKFGFQHLPQGSRDYREPVDGCHTVASQRIELAVADSTAQHTFLAILLYSSMNSCRSPISSVSDRPPRSPLVEVHVALLRTPLEVLLTGRDRRAREAAAKGLGCRSGVTASRDALMFILCARRGVH